MVTAAPEPQPLMFVPRELDHQWIGNFLKKKHLALSHSIGKHETTSLFYSLEDFTDVIDRIAAIKDAGIVKLYFATYCLTGVPEIDAIAQSGWNDQLTLLFAAADNRRTDLGAFFLIRPQGGVLALTADTARTLVQCYWTRKVPLLNKIMRDNGRGNFEETRTFSYSLPKFNGPYGLIRELNRHRAAGVTAFFGTYGPGEKTPMREDVSGQLNLVFELVRSVEHEGRTYHYHFDLEDTEGWADRPQAPGLILQGGDTGNPCPPPTVCSTTLG